MKQFFEKHKTWFLLIGGTIGIFLFYRWYQGYAANQSANDAANQAAQDEAAQNAIENSLAAQGSGSTGGSTTGSSVPLVNVMSPPGTTTTQNSNGAGAGGSAPQSSSSPGTLQNLIDSTQSGPPSNIQTTQALSPGSTGNGLFGGPGTTAAQVQALQAGVGNPSAWTSTGFGSYNYVLNEAAAESEPGYNQSQFDQYWATLNQNPNQLTDAAAISTPAFIAYEGSNPEVVNTDLEAQGLPPAFILPTPTTSAPASTAPAPTQSNTPIPITSARPSTITDTGSIGSSNLGSGGTVRTPTAPVTRPVTPITPSTGNTTRPSTINGTGITNTTAPTGVTNPTAPVVKPVTPITTPIKPLKGTPALPTVKSVFTATR